MSHNPFAPPQQSQPGFSWGHGPAPTANPFAGPSQPPQQPTYGAQQPSYGAQQPYMQPQPTGYGQPQFQAPQPTGGGSGFQPSSAFGQHLQAQMTGYGQQQQHYAQQPQRQGAFLSDLDPLNIPPGWGGGSAPPSASPYSGHPGPSAPSPAPTSSYRIEDHPREVVRKHKPQLEVWDAYAWKQAIGAYEGLQKAWEERKAKLMRALDGGLNPQDGETCRKVRRAE